MSAHRSFLRPTLPALCLAFVLAGCPSGDDPPSYEWEEAFDASSTGWLLNVWGPSGDDLYAVGGSPDTGVMMHWDGESWSEVDLGLDVPLLNWIYGFGPDDIWAVGDDGTIIHWDGSEWTLVPPATPTDQNLWGVWGASSDDMWAVGGNGRAEGQATILRYDGSEWSAVEVPELMRSMVWAFFKVWGTSSDNVYIVGQRGAVLQWNGTELVEHLVGTSDDLISLWGTGPDRIGVVGGRGNGVVSTWDGTEWHTESLAPLPGLNGVWTRRPDVLHVVGIEGTIAVVDFETLEYRDDYQDTRLAFHAVFGDDGDKLTTVGGNLANPAGPYQGIAYTRDLREDE